MSANSSSDDKPKTKTYRRKVLKSKKILRAELMVPRPLKLETPLDENLRPHNEVYIERLYDTGKKLIADIAAGDSIIEELTDLGAKLMEGVAIYPGLTGTEKKIIVLKVIRMLCSEIPMTLATSNIVTAVVTFVVPHMIDVIISAADGSLDLGRKWRTAKKLWNACTGICGCRCAGCKCPN